MGKGGELENWGRCMKKSLICINIIILLGAVIVFSVGIWVWTNRSESASLLNSKMFISVMAIVVTMAAFVIIVSLFGLYGAIKEDKRTLITYSILLFIIFLGMFIGGILQFVFRKRILTKLDESTMYSTMAEYNKGEMYTKAWDSTQTYLECCGVKSYTDWKNNVPESCCKKELSGQRLNCMTTPQTWNTYTDGCHKKTKDFLRKSACYVGAIALIIAFIMLAASVLACGLFFKIK